MEQQCEILRDTAGNILVDGGGYVTCESKEGLKFQVRYQDIDFDNDILQCVVEDKVMLIQLKHKQITETNTVDDGSTIADTDGRETNEGEGKKEAFAWNNANTMLYFALYKEKKSYLEARKIRTKKALWRKISEAMLEHGYNASPIQVENRFKTLERSYKNMVLNNKKTGRARTSCPYEAELAELLGHKHNIEPLAVSGRSGLQIRNDGIDNTNMSEVLVNEGLVEEEDIEPEAIPSTSTANLTSSEVPKHQAVTPKSARKQMGATAKALQSCQASIEKMVSDIKENKEKKSEIHKQILAESKAFRQQHQQSMEKITEQLVEANRLREEKNKILKEMLQQMRGNNSE